MTPEATGLSALPPVDNLAWAQLLIDTLVAQGASDFVASPGSRSTPLTLAALRHPRARVKMVLDERSAAFYALGLTRASGAPAALIATSGSAPAHWLPAVIEASHGQLPLILLSADRPEELHRCGANQTTAQSRLFADHARGVWQAPHPASTPAIQRGLAALAAEAIQRARWPEPGPVHINLPFREPILGERPAPPEGDDHRPSPRGSADGVKDRSPESAAPVSIPPTPLTAPPPQAPNAALIDTIAPLLQPGQGLIIAGPARYGDAFPDAIQRLAKQRRAPILADPLSNLRWGPHVDHHIHTAQDHWLRAPSIRQALQPRWILRFGAAPVSRSLLQFLEDQACEQILITPYPTRPDPIHRATRTLTCDPALFCNALLDKPSPRGRGAGVRAQPEDAPRPADTLQQTQAAEKITQTSTNLPDEALIIQALIEQLPANAPLFCGNSMAIRDLDAFARNRQPPLTLHANRGVSGIDGNIATLLGLAARHPGKTVGLIGDLTFWHDANALLLANDHDALIIVLNNGGGGIFEYLPQQRLEEFEEGWLTPLDRQIADAARMHRIRHSRCKTEAFASLLTQALARKGLEIMEVMIDRERSVLLHKAHWALSSTAFHGGMPPTSSH